MRGVTQMPHKYAVRLDYQSLAMLEFEKDIAIKLDINIICARVKSCLVPLWRCGNTIKTMVKDCQIPDDMKRRKDYEFKRSIPSWECCENRDIILVEEPPNEGRC